MFRNQIYVPKYYMCHHARYSINIHYFAINVSDCQVEREMRQV